MFGILDPDDSTATKYLSKGLEQEFKAREPQFNWDFHTILGDLINDPRWTRRRLTSETRVGLWTDDFSNLLGVFKWGDK